MLDETGNTKQWFYQQVSSTCLILNKQALVENCISETHRDVLKYAIKVVKNALFILQIRLELSPLLHEL